MKESFGGAFMIKLVLVFFLYMILFLGAILGISYLLTWL